MSATRESQGRGAECCQGPTQELETRGFGERWHALTTLRLLEPIGIVRSFSSPGAWARTVSSVTERKVKGAEASFMDTGQEQQHAARALGRSYVRVPLRSSLLLQLTDPIPGSMHALLLVCYQATITGTRLVLCEPKLLKLKWWSLITDACVPYQITVAADK